MITFRVQFTLDGRKCSGGVVCLSEHNSCPRSEVYGLVGFKLVWLNSVNVEVRQVITEQFIWWLVTFQAHKNSKSGFGGGNRYWGAHCQRHPSPWARAGEVGCQSGEGFQRACHCRCSLSIRIWMHWMIYGQYTWWIMDGVYGYCRRQWLRCWMDSMQIVIMRAFMSWKRLPEFLTLVSISKQVTRQRPATSFPIVKFLLLQVFKRLLWLGPKRTSCRVLCLRW